MAFLQTQFFSVALNVEVTVNVLLPEGNQGIGVDGSGDREPAKVLYLLHGYSDDHSIWMRRTSVERYAAAHNLAVIMPAVNHSYYLNEVQGEKYWDFVSEELPKTMQRFFRISDRWEDTFVAGLSMGGYGAMKLALTYPERFRAAASFSGVVDFVGMTHSNPVRADQWRRIAGDLEKIEGSDKDLFALLEKNKDAEHKPSLFVSCGTNDSLFGQHQRFIPALKENGWQVAHAEVPERTHEWRFWDEQIRFFIPWMLGRNDLAEKVEPPCLTK